MIPIAIVMAAITGFTTSYDDIGETTVTITTAGIGLLFLPPLLLILFREKYPRWWFDWNLNFQRFSNRIGVYVALMDDAYPSTDEEQSVHLGYEYPDAKAELGRGMPLVKWLLAIPHYIVLFFLTIGAFFAVVFAWFAILFTGRYPRGPVRVRRRRDALAQPGHRLRVRAGHRQLPAVPARPVGAAAAPAA